MGTLIAALHWLARYLDSRFPPKVDPRTLVTQAEFDSFVAVALAKIEKLEAADRSDITKLKDQMEKISLLIGLSRPMQTVLKEKFK